MIPGIPRMVVPPVARSPTPGVLAGAELEAVALARRVGLGRGGFAQQRAKVDEMPLCRRAPLQLRRPPLGDEPARRHHADREDARAGPWWW